MSTVGIQNNPHRKLPTVYKEKLIRVPLSFIILLVHWGLLNENFKVYTDPGWLSGGWVGGGK